MRLVVATQHLGIVGGVETHLRSILPTLHRSFQLALLTATSAPDLSGSILAGWEQPIDHWVTSQPSWQRELSDWSPDLVYLHGFDDPAVDRFLATNHRTILFAHNYYGMCISGTKRLGFPSPRPCSRRFGARCIPIYPLRRCGGLNPTTMASLFAQQTQRLKLLRSFPMILVASRAMREELLRHDVPPRAIRHVPLFPADSASNHPPVPSPGWHHRLVVVGRLTELKGTHLLLRALPEIQRRLGRRFEVVIAGDGPERSRLEALATRLAIQVRFTGWIAPAERDELFLTCDLLIMPGTWPEPFGLSGIEAGRQGVPTTAFATGGITDWCREGVSGTLAPADPPRTHQLADAIVRALQSKTVHDRLRFGAWEVSQEYALPNHVRQLRSAFDEVIQASPRPATLASIV